MTKMCSFRMEKGAIEIINYLQEKSGYSKSEIINKALWHLLFNEMMIGDKGKIIKWSKDEFLLDK